jgi:hypothetical protein
MLKRLSMVFLALGLLGVGGAHAQTGTIVAVDADTWTLTPAVGAAMTFNCFPCAISTTSLPAGYTNPYEGGDAIALQRDKFFGADSGQTVLETDAGNLTNASYTVGPTKGIMVKDDGSTFFFDRVGGIGSITFSFVGKTASNVTFTPIPAALVLLLTGLAGLFGLKRYRQRQFDGAVPA